MQTGAAILLTASLVGVYGGAWAASVNPPTVTAVSPTFGPAGGGTDVTLSGDKLCDGVTAVNFGATPAERFTVKTLGIATKTKPARCELHAVSPRGAGIVDITATGRGGTSATGPQDRFSYAPVITGVSPTFGPAGGGTDVTLSGDNLCDGVTAVNFGATPAERFTVKTLGTATKAKPARCELHAVSPRGAGIVDITATGRGGTSATGPQDRFSYAPVVTRISPNFGPTGGGTTVTINGDNLCDGVAAVYFGSTPATGISVKALGPAAKSATPGKCDIAAVSPRGTGVVDVTVRARGGTSATGPQDRFSYAPVVTRISPNFGPSMGGTTVTITGENLCDHASAVTFGSKPAMSFTVRTVAPATKTQQARCEIDAESPPGTGVVDVTVTSRGGTSSATRHDLFTYESPVPAVTAITPTSGPTTGGTQVTITGSGFTGATAVQFGTNAATSVTVSSDTSILAASPPGAGSVDVTVTTPGGTSPTTAADVFSYFISAPTVTGITPTTGPAGGGTQVTITGSGFTGATAVQFGTNAATSVTVSSDTSIVAASPPGGGSVDVTVTTPGGTSPTTAADVFAYTVTPSATPTFISKFGSHGTGNGQFNSPWGIAVAPDTHNVYVVDEGNDRVEIFDSSGNYVSQFGSPGSGNGQFIGPEGIAIDPGTHTVYVADSFNNRVEVFDSAGNYKSQFGGSVNQVADPAGVAFDPATNTVYVTTASGGFGVAKFTAAGNFVLRFGTAGFGNGQFFQEPIGIAVDPTTSHVLVAAQQQGTVEVFDASGTYLSKFGTFGSNNEQLRNPQGVAVAAGIYTYVTDEWNDAMVQFDQSGSPIYQVGSSTAGTGDGQFSGPIGIGVDPGTYHIYIADTLNDRVQVFG